METYWQIEKVNLKYHVPLHFLVCVLLLAVSPLLMGVENLAAEDTAKVLERYVALTGIIMITPIFLPEQDKNLRELVRAKYVNSASVYLARLLGNVLLLMFLLGMYMFMLYNGGCSFPMVKYFLGTLAEMLFLGGLGVCFYGIADNLVAGYMAPMVYYIAAIGGGDKYLKLLYPFSMSAGSYTEKYCLFGAAVLLITAGIFFRVYGCDLKSHFHAIPCNENVTSD